MPSRTTNAGSGVTAQKEAEELLDVHGSGTEQGIDGIALRAFESIALQSVFSLEVSDGRFDDGAAFHPLPNSLWDRAPAAFIDDACLRALMIVAPVTPMSTWPSFTACVVTNRRT